VRKKTKKKSSSRRPSRTEHWSTLPKEALLDLRLCDLGLRIEGTELEGCVARLYEELATRGIRFRPHVWLSTEWFSPDGVPGFAIPFYLAHPRLKRLEEEIMLEAEGGTKEECMKLMRHETAHAFANAYRIHRRRDWREHFGKSTQKYPRSYLPHPYSKRFVIHLDNWYAQSHPDEDWAETFAVWLQPDYDWRSRYRGWPALKKLEYVDRLMQELGDRPPLVRRRSQEAPVSRLRVTLRRYFRDKQARYRVKPPGVYDRDLRQLFSDDPTHRQHESAAHYLRRNRHEIVAIVARWTSEYRYRVDQVLEEIMKRCETLDLHVVHDNPALKLNVVAFLTRLLMEYLHTGRFLIML
jgi:hypothetical protein